MIVFACEISKTLTSVVVQLFLDYYLAVCMYLP